MDGGSCHAAVITPPGSAAIAGIELGGNGAEQILRGIFKTSSSVRLETGQILVGQIADGADVIDQVVVGCEAHGRFVIHCHGNPLLVETVMKLLQDRGARLVSFEAAMQMRPRRNGDSAITSEAGIERLKAVTLEGFRFVSNQITGGLSAAVVRWRDHLQHGELAAIHNDCRQILSDSRIAQRIIRGCAGVIVGPPNSGKSTLFNRLCGMNKSIVADIGGTTRDWVSAIWRTKSLRMELFDTAGLDDALAQVDPLQAASQQRTREIIRQSDVVIVVVDGSKPLEHFSLAISRDQIVIAALNKSDLPQSLDPTTLPFSYAEMAAVSAQTGHGIDGLTKAVRGATGVDGFDLSRPICFTERQNGVVNNLSQATTSEIAHDLLEQLLMDSTQV